MKLPLAAILAATCFPAGALTVLAPCDHVPARPIIVLDKHGIPILKSPRLKLRGLLPDFSAIPAQFNKLPIKTTVTVDGEEITIYALTQEHVDRVVPTLKEYLCSQPEYAPLFPILCPLGQPTTGKRLPAPTADPTNWTATQAAGSTDERPATTPTLDHTYWDKQHSAFSAITVVFRHGNDSATSKIVLSNGGGDSAWPTTANRNGHEYNHHTEWVGPSRNSSKTREAAQTGHHEWSNVLPTVSSTDAGQTTLNNTTSRGGGFLYPAKTRLTRSEVGKSRTATVSSDSSTSTPRSSIPPAHNTSATGIGTDTPRSGKEPTARHRTTNWVTLTKP